MQLNTNPSVLLVESNLFIGGILSQKLQQAGYNVTATKDGKEGLHKIVEVKPDVVFLDLPMGQVKTFLGVLREIHNRHHAIVQSFIFLSDVEKGEDITKISELGVHSYMIKAYTDTDEMVAKIREVIGKTDMLAVHQHLPPQPLKPVISEQKRIKAEIEK